MDFVALKKYVKISFYNNFTQFRISNRTLSIYANELKQRIN